MTSNDRTIRLGMAAVVGLLILIRTPGAAAAERNASAPWIFGLRAEGELRYDDNILSLSDTEKDQVGDPAFAGKFRIESPGDVVVAPSLGLSLSRSPRRGRDTDILLSVRDHAYTRNSVKSWTEIGLSFRQELNRSRFHRTAVTVGGSQIPSYYLRELIDDDESQAAGRVIRNSLDYQLNRGYFEISQEIVNRVLSVSARYARERRDYNDHFNERDGSSDVTSLEVSVFPLGRNAFRVQPYYEHERRGSLGDLGSTPVPDDQVGFDGDVVGLDLRWLWGADPDRRQSVNGFYESETRDFTTTSTTDLGHFDREDEIAQFGLGWSREFGPAWRANVSYRFRNNDVTLPAAAGGRATIGHEKNVVSAALVYRYERRLGRAGGRAGATHGREGRPEAP